MSDLAINPQPNILSYNTAAPPAITKKQYELFTLYNDKNPMLLQRMPEFDFHTFDKSPITVIDFCNQLLHTMNHYGGIGLAAPQCGFPYRLFVLAGGIVCINPVIVEISKERGFTKEGCLSFPGLYLSIWRPSTVKMKYTNEFGERIEVTWTGATARAALHEYDHLEGRVFTSLVGNLTLQMAKKKRQKMFKKIQKVVDFKAQQLRIAGKDKEYVERTVAPRAVEVQSNRVT